MGSPRAGKRVGHRQLLMAFLTGCTFTLLCLTLLRKPAKYFKWPNIEGPARTPNEQWHVPSPVPWVPVLSPEQLRRGISFYGSGSRIERVAAKLMAGQPITAVTIGGSVTRGAGASSEDLTYPSLFFNFIQSTFPHSGHVLLNKGIGATTSGIFSVCAEALVPKDADLVVVEFTFNEVSDVPYTAPSRRGFEHLLRKLLRMKHSPAVIMLHHYSWYFSFGDGVDAGLYYRPAEAQLGTLAQYYDMPALSMRNAIYSLMQSDTPPFGVSKVHVAGKSTSRRKRIRSAGPNTRHKYYYYDDIHPWDTGHRAMAELLAGVLATAAQSLLAAHDGPAVSHLGLPWNGSDAASTLNASQLLVAASNVSAELPPPMIPGNAEKPTTLCAMQEEFKPLGKRLSGFRYKAERPSKRTFVEQKWGYTGDTAGAWIELEVSTEESPGLGGQATVHLGYLRSYAGMGLAQVDCMSGCRCKRTLMNGLWAAKVSLMQMHSFQVTQHPRCVIRVSIVERRADSPGGLHPKGAGMKFQLNSIMVAHTPLVLSSYSKQAEDMVKHIAA